MDLVQSFIHDVETAFSRKEEVTLVTIDVQGVFDTLLKQRTLRMMQSQEFSPNLLGLINSFLPSREVQVGQDMVIRAANLVECGTPHGSRLSPILCMLRIAPLILQALNPRLRFGCANDIAIYQASKSLDTNCALLVQDIRDITLYGSENKIFSAP